MSGPAELTALVREERLATIRLLEELPPAGWATPSLCEGWTVQEVAAHLAWAPVLPPAAVLGGLLRSGFRVNRFTRVSAQRWAERGREAILDQLRRNAETGVKPVGVPAMAPLSDAVVHGLDVRVPLGLPRPVAPEVFAPLAAWHLGLRWPGSALVGGDVRRRITGVELVAEDAGWVHGQGPQVRASAATLMLVVAGRPVDPTELRGPGAALVAARLAR